MFATFFAVQISELITKTVINFMAYGIMILVACMLMEGVSQKKYTRYVNIGLVVLAIWLAAQFLSPIAYLLAMLVEIAIFLTVFLLTAIAIEVVVRLINNDDDPLGNVYANLKNSLAARRRSRDANASLLICLADIGGVLHK